MWIKTKDGLVGIGDTAFISHLESKDGIRFFRDHARKEQFLFVSGPHAQDVVEGIYNEIEEAIEKGASVVNLVEYSSEAPAKEINGATVLAARPRRGRKQISSGI